MLKIYSILCSLAKCSAVYKLIYRYIDKYTDSQMGKQMLWVHGYMCILITSNLT